MPARSLRTVGEMHALLTSPPGDNPVASSYLRRDVHAVHSFANLGIEARFFNVANPDEAASLIDENTKYLLGDY